MIYIKYCWNKIIACEPRKILLEYRNSSSFWNDMVLNHFFPDAYNSMLIQYCSGKYWILDRSGSFLWDLPRILDKQHVFSKCRTLFGYIISPYSIISFKKQLILIINDANYKFFNQQISIVETEVFETLL